MIPQKTIDFCKDMDFSSQFGFNRLQNIFQEPEKIVTIINSW